ncbi:oxidative damage protection protein [Buchnera aphidicola]|uniref:oxidative damage protection protein n=1 Tax=Buchnera aphidicola TaxID=9 RepID=UPI003463A2AC
MHRIIFCTFLKKKSEGQDYPPYPGKLGKKIYNEISKVAWKEWKLQQTKIINEEKLDMFNKNDRKKIEYYMKLFLFKNE